MTFNPNNLPEAPTPVFDVSGLRIGTFNPHTHIIHPTADSPYGALRLLGGIAFDMAGKMVGRFSTAGKLQPAKQTSEAAAV